MKKLVILFFSIIVMFSNVAFAEQYVANNKVTYIGKTQKHRCYIYDFDVNLTINYTAFNKTGNWSATVVLEPTTKEKREKFISYLQQDIDSNNIKTIVLPVRDNKFWAFAIRFTYFKYENKLFLKDSYWLNSYGAIIAMTETNQEEAVFSEGGEDWEIQELIDKHIHKRYKDEYERRNTVVR